MAVRTVISFSARGYELDSYNHVNNAVYLNYLEHARWDHFRRLGLHDFIVSGEVKPVVTDMNIRYQREIRLFDNLEIESECHPEHPWLIFRQKIINLTTGLPAARATTRLVFIDRDRVVQDIPPALLAAI